jgi:hypothetical protein
MCACVYVPVIVACRHSIRLISGTRPKVVGAGVPGHARGFGSDQYNGQREEAVIAETRRKGPRLAMQRSSDPLHGRYSERAIVG